MIAKKIQNESAVPWPSAVSEWTRKFVFCIDFSMGTYVPPNTRKASSCLEIEHGLKLEVLTGDWVAVAREGESRPPAR